MTAENPAPRSAWRDAPPPLIVITDTTVAKEGVLEERVECVLAMARPGSVMVQLRDLAFRTGQRLGLGERLVAVCRRHGQWFVVNDRLDLAVLLGADGVHLGEGGVEAADARAVLTPGAWISRACHDPESVTRLDADAVLLSPVAAARKGRPALGPDGVTRARVAIAAMRPADRPLLYALGGIDASNAATFIAEGADGVAVIGAALDGDGDGDGRDPEPLLVALGIRRR